MKNRIFAIVCIVAALCMFVLSIPSSAQDMGRSAIPFTDVLVVSSGYTENFHLSPNLEQIKTPQYTIDVEFYDGEYIFTFGSGSQTIRSMSFYCNYGYVPISNSSVDPNPVFFQFTGSQATFTLSFDYDYSTYTMYYPPTTSFFARAVGFERTEEHFELSIPFSQSTSATTYTQSFPNVMNYNTVYNVVDDDATFIKQESAYIIGVNSVFVKNLAFTVSNISGANSIVLPSVDIPQTWKTERNEIVATSGLLNNTVSLSESLFSPVEAFLDIQITPSISLGMIFWAIFGIFVIFVLIKIFS